MNRTLSVLVRLHAPPVERPEGPAAERLYALVAESILPLVETLRGLGGHGPACTVVITPLLAETWSDPAIQAGVGRHLDARVAAAKGPLRRRAEATRALWHLLGGDLDRAFRELARDGAVELATTPATDAALPLIGERAFARPQIALAVATHTRHFGAPPAGIDLTRGYSPRIDLLCAEYGLRWCLVAPAAFERATARPVYGPWAPLLCPNSGLAAFVAEPAAADLPPVAARALHGVVRDLGLRAPPVDWHPALHPEALGDRPPLDRSTRADVFAEPWSIEAAEQAAAAVADPWLEARRTEARAAAAELGRTPHRAVAFDGALFGRWWGGGRGFLARVVADRLMTTPARWLEENPVHQSAWPGLGRSGPNPGFAAAGDDPDREWLLDALPLAAARMTRLADRFAGMVPAERRPAEEAARALLLAQCGDWPLMIEHGAAGLEAVDAVRGHLARFERLADAVDAPGEAEAPAVRLFEDLDLTPFASW